MKDAEVLSDGGGDDCFVAPFDRAARTKATRASVKRNANNGSRVRPSDWNCYSGNPATTEVEYTGDQLDYLKAIEAFKARTGRAVLTNCEILAVAELCGWNRTDVARDDYRQAALLRA